MLRCPTGCAACVSSWLSWWAGTEHLGSQLLFARWPPPHDECVIAHLWSIQCFQHFEAQGCQRLPAGISLHCPTLQARSFWASALYGSHGYAMEGACYAHLLILCCCCFSYNLVHLFDPMILPPFGSASNFVAAFFIISFCMPAPMGHNLAAIHVDRYVYMLIGPWTCPRS